MVQFFFNWFFLSTLRRVSAWITFLISLDFFCLVFYTTKTFRDILTLSHATHYHNGGGVNRNTIWVKIPLFLRGKSIFEVFVKRKTIFDIRSSRMPLTFGIHKTCLRFVEVHEIVNNSVHVCDDYFAKHTKKCLRVKIHDTHDNFVCPFYFKGPLIFWPFRCVTDPYFCHHDMKNRNENKRRKKWSWIFELDFWVVLSDHLSSHDFEVELLLRWRISEKWRW